MNRGLLYIILAMACIGISIPIGGSAMMKVPVWLYTSMTLLVASIVLVPFATIYEKIKWTKLGPKNYYGIFMQSLLTCALYTVFLLYGLANASAISVGIISSTTPAVVLILSFFLLRERLNIRRIFAILLSVLAVLIMNIAGVEINGGSSWMGIVFMLLVVLSLSLFFIYAKKFSVELPPYTLAAGLCLMGLIMTLPMAIYELNSFDWEVLTVNDWWSTILYGLIGWAIAYIFTFLGMPKVSASTAGMATAIIPIASTLTAIIFYGANIRTVDVIALVLVIASIIIAEMKTKNEHSYELQEDDSKIIKNI